MFPQANFGIQKGFTEFETVQGTLNSDSRLFKIDSTVGWDFNKTLWRCMAACRFTLPAFLAATATSYYGSDVFHQHARHRIMPTSAWHFARRVPLWITRGAITVSAPTGSTSNGSEHGARRR